MHIPRTFACLEKLNVRSFDSRPRQPTHVIFNMAANLLTRRNRNITGSQRQQNFVQRLASTLFGVTYPILYLMGMLFPKHFWSSASLDRHALLGCPPISCYRGDTNSAEGFASTLETSRYLVTHASSSTATDDNFVSFCWDIQANIAGSKCDSRILSKSGFTVDTKAKSGLKPGNRDNSELRESVDSSQEMMNLAAASVKHEFHFFLTYTCNQGDHPGIRHLHQWKECKEWTSMIPGYSDLSTIQREDVHLSMEMAYSNILTRSWLEVRKFWIRFIMKSTSSCLKKVIVGFFRDEYQPEIGNLSHIHALIGLLRKDMSDEEFKDFICDLQVNGVCDIVPAFQLNDFIEKGLIKDLSDWSRMTCTADRTLTHTCGKDRRCFVSRYGTGPDDFYCRRQNPALFSKNPMKHEFVPLPVVFSKRCPEILRGAGFYIPPCKDYPEGKFCHKMLEPKRHVGVIKAGSRHNISPVIPEHFTFARSSQNAQIIHGTNGVTRYVVKVSLFHS